jgi:hypothetical protein
MGLRFRGRLRLAPGLAVNLSKRGASLSIGGRGATVNVGRRGVRGTVGMPGTGISYSEQIAGGAAPIGAGRRLSNGGVVGAVILLVIIIGILWAAAS